MKVDILAGPGSHILREPTESVSVQNQYATRCRMAAHPSISPSLFLRKCHQGVPQQLSRSLLRGHCPKPHPEATTFELLCRQLGGNMTCGNFPQLWAQSEMQLSSLCPTFPDCAGDRRMAASWHTGTSVENMTSVIHLLKYL